MPPNNIELASVTEPEIVVGGDKPAIIRPGPQNEENYGIKIFQSSIILVANIMIGATLGFLFMFSFRNGLPLGSTPMHIVLCVIGYQLLMAQAILSLSPNNGWSVSLTLVHKRRAHWILQIAGSALAISGTFYKILDKDVHFNTPHGVCGLVALVFTTVSLVNGLTSLYAYELRRILPGNLSKITHICFGTVAFVSASVCLCLGMAKTNFVLWATKPIADTFIAFVSIFTFIIIVNPLLTFFNKSRNVFNK